MNPVNVQEILDVGKPQCIPCITGFCRFHLSEMSDLNLRFQQPLYLLKCDTLMNLHVKYVA